MKQYGFIYTNFNEMKSFIHSISIHTEHNILVQVFTGVIEIEFITKIINEITSLLPQAEIIGTTTAGEIFEGNIFTDTTIISFSIFEKTKIKTKLLNNNNNENELGMSIVRDLVEENTKVIILFSEGLLMSGQGIIKGIQAANSNIVICGGKASDNGYFKKTFIFTKEKIMQNGTAAVSLTGKDLNVTTEYSFCWCSIGKLMTVTKAIDNRIYTINNMKTVDIYKKYLGNEVAEELPMSATEFPLIIKKDSMSIARVAFRCHNDGSMSFLGNIETGDKVQFGYGNINMIINNSLNIVNSLENKPIQGIFIYSCSVRRSFMQNNIKLETLPLNNIAPAYGFFTYGEFFTANHSNQLLNATMTILGLSEGQQILKNNKKSVISEKYSSKNFFQGKDLGVIRVFTHLTNEVTKELQEANELLECQRRKIEQMKNITNSIMEINNEILSSGEIGNLLQMILNKSIDLIPNAQIGSILFLENGKLIYKASKGYLFNELTEITYDIEDIYQCKLYSSGDLYEPTIITELHKFLFNKKDMYNTWKNMFDKIPVELLCYSIVIDEKMIGFINLFNTNNKSKFSEEDKLLVKHLCNEIAMALKNAQLIQNTLYMSRHDGLTGLYNRRYFREILNKTLNKVVLLNETFVTCIIDLNNLKVVNDNYGHDIGDKFLIKFVEIFKDGIDDNDVFGRSGGDEFEVIFINKNEFQALDIIERINFVFKSYSFDFDENIKITFAYGLAEFPKDSTNITELLKIADKRMYEKKKKMKNLL
jgi:diguanylate cyclase (GGDEF)-like protein